MTNPDDTSRERDDRPTDPIPSPPEAEENGHAIPFGEGVYGLGRERPPEDRTSQSFRGTDPSGTFGDDLPPAGGDDLPPAGRPRHEPPRHEPPRHEPPRNEPPRERELPPDFDFGRLASELGFDGHTEGRQCVGFCPICRSADLLRSVTTPELRAAWGDFQRELARSLRAAAERYAVPEKGEPPDAAERITEIPID